MSRFAAGQIVRVRDLAVQGHMRCPGYLRRQTGRICRWLGRFRNPEALAYARPAEERDLYLVRFSMHTLWPDYSGSTQDQLLAEIYEHWLDPVSSHRSGV